MKHSGGSYLGGHTILHGSGLIGLDRPTYGQVKKPNKRWPELPNIKNKGKWKAWAERKKEIGSGKNGWALRKKEIETRIQKALKEGAHDAQTISDIWNVEGFKTFTGVKWRSSLVWTACTAVGMHTFLQSAADQHSKHASKWRRVRPAK